MPTQELRDGVDRLVQVYHNDLEETMADEIVHFAALCKIFPFSKPAESKQSKELQMFVMLKKQSLESVFPNVTIALRMYLLSFKASEKHAPFNHVSKSLELTVAALYRKRETSKPNARYFKKRKRDTLKAKARYFKSESEILQKRKRDTSNDGDHQQIC